MSKGNTRSIVYLLLVIALAILLIHIFYNTSWNLVLQMVHSGDEEGFKLGDMYSRSSGAALSRSGSGKGSQRLTFRHGSNVEMYKRK